MERIVNMYDMHIHTENSHDSIEHISNIIKKAKELGLSGIGISDHFDNGAYDDYNSLYNESFIKKSYDSASIYENDESLKVLKGVEIGESILNLDRARKLVQSLNFDFIIGSVHGVFSGDLIGAFSRIDFSQEKEDDIIKYLDLYFDDVIKMIDNFDFDILAHLTVPLRYINGKYNRNISLNSFDQKIDIILKKIINKNISLEINTSCLKSNYSHTLPSLDIIKRYKELGGFLLTIGSDAHFFSNVSFEFVSTIEKIKEIGFKHLYYYENRKPVKYEI